MGRKVFRIILLGFLLAVALSAGASAAVVDSGTCGDNLTWTFDDAGTLTISGTGPMSDSVEVFYGGIWEEHKDSIRKVEIEDGVTSIEGCVFINCVNLTDIRIPDSVTKIGLGAFAYCSSLESVFIPSGVAEFGWPLEYSDFFSTNNPYSPFEGCARLADIRVSPANAAFAEVDGVMFAKDMTALMAYPPARTGAYRIPDGVTKIGVGAFCSCKGLTSVSMPDSLTSVGHGAFFLCDALANVKASKNLTEIGPSGFAGCKALNRFVFPAGFERVGSFAFNGCDAMESIVFSEGFTEILSRGPYTRFCDEETKTITIPASVKKIAASVFYSASSYDVYYEGTEEQWNAIEYVDYLWSKGSPFENSTIHCNSPMPNTDTHAGEISLSGTAASVAAYAAEPATAYFAAYSVSGQFLGAQARALALGKNDTQSFSVPSGAAIVKLFILRDDSAILCPVRVKETQ